MTRAEPHVKFARRICGLRPSCVREIMRAGEGRDMLSFAGGLPNPRLFPSAELETAFTRVLRERGGTALQYGSSEGYRPLREFVCAERLAPLGIEAVADEILITSGSQQALDLVARVFIDPGDLVAMESPSYLSAIQAFELCEPCFVTVPLGRDGIDTEQLACVLRRDAPKLLYVGPTFQNPTGLCYTDAVRREVARLVDEAGTLLVEDDPYGELRYDGGPHPRPIHAYGARRGVLMGSFSKIVTPGLRMGWVYAPAETLRAMVVAKQAADLCSSTLVQMVLHELLAGGFLRGHIERLRASYRVQRDVLLDVLRCEMPEGTRWTEPRGGMFVWVTLPEGVSAEALLAATLPRGVAFAPGRSFHPVDPPVNTLRLNFTLNEADAIRRGVRVIAEEIGKLMKADRKSAMVNA